MYNRDKFNRGKFNTSSSTKKLFIELLCRFKTSIPIMKIRVKAESEMMTSKFQNSVFLKAWLNLWMDFKFVFDCAAKMIVAINIKDTKTGARFTISAPPIQSMLSTYIDLLGITLHPTETLIIDCENMTITKNGVTTIEYWQLGSEFFEMTAGENMFKYIDTDSERNIELTIQWRNRWL